LIDLINQHLELPQFISPNGTFWKLPQNRSEKRIDGNPAAHLPGMISLFAADVQLISQSLVALKILAADIG
jgi:hypothetical protein